MSNNSFPTTQSAITSTMHRLYLYGFISDERVFSQEFVEFLCKARDAGDSDMLEIRICSEGGSIRAAKVIMNLIQECYSKDCTTIIEQEACSAAALIFLCGNNRIAYEDSYLMLHNYSAGFYGKGHELKAQARAVDTLLEAMFTRILSRYLSDREIADLFEGKDLYFDVKSMCARGMINGVVLSNGECVNANKYLTGEVNAEVESEKSETGS